MVLFFCFRFFFAGDDDNDDGVLVRLFLHAVHGHVHTSVSTVFDAIDNDDVAAAATVLVALAVLLLLLLGVSIV